MCGTAHGGVFPGLIVGVADYFAAGSGAQRSENGAIDVVAQESNGAVGKQHVYAAGVSAEEVVQGAIGIVGVVNGVGLSEAEVRGRVGRFRLVAPGIGRPAT